METNEIIQISAIMLSAIGIIIAFNSNKTQLKIFNKQLKLNFFAEYTKRYQEIILSFPSDINSTEFDLQDLEATQRDNILRVMRVYFDLCSEEFHLYNSDCLDNKVWTNWEEGINSAMSKKAFKESWRIVSTNSIYDGEFKEWMDNHITSNMS